MDYISSAKFKQTNTGKIAKQIDGAPMVDAERRVLRFVISSGTPDRDNDVIKQDGVDYSHYMNGNPVLCWGHDTSELPIGRCIGITIVDGKLTASFEILPADMPLVGERAEAVYRMCKEGFLFATSIGFLPIEWERSEDRDGGYDFIKTSLLEVSVVTVPANPEATIIQTDKASTLDADKSINNTDGAKARRKRIYDYITARR